MSGKRSKLNFIQILRGLSNTYQAIRLYIKSIDPVLFTFLVLVLNVSLPLKLLAVIFTYALNFDLKSIITNLKNDRIPKLYAFMILLSVVGFILNYRLWNLNYTLLTCFGICFWIMSLLILNRLKLITDRLSPEKIHQTLKAFFLLNALVCFFNLLQIILITKSNPYTFQGMDLKYHASTGDSITGILFDFSSTNAIINIFGIFYFLYKQSYKTSLICLIVCLMTTSNTNTIVLISMVLLMIMFRKETFYKIAGAFYLVIIVVFFAKVSPPNIEYVLKELSPEKEQMTVVSPQENAPRTLSPEELKEKQREIFQKYYVSKLPKDHKSVSKIDTNIRTALAKIETREKEKQNASDPKFQEQMKSKHDKLSDYIKEFYGDTIVPMKEFEGKHYPGKLMSCIQTIRYSISGIKACLFGAGTGMFSSKAAFKASGIGTFGKYPERFEYISPDFKNNNLKVYCYFFSMALSKHSVTNTPFSSYNQLLGEYGIAGIICFLIFYVWFFLKRFKQLSYGRYLLPLCLMFLIFDYWFEHLSILIIFELLMLIDIKEKNRESEAPVA